MIISIKDFANRFPGSTIIITIEAFTKHFPSFIMITAQVFVNHFP